MSLTQTSSCPHQEAAEEHVSMKTGTPLLTAKLRTNSCPLQKDGAHHLTLPNLQAGSGYLMAKRKRSRSLVRECDSLGYILIHSINQFHLFPLQHKLVNSTSVAHHPISRALSLHRDPYAVSWLMGS